MTPSVYPNVGPNIKLNMGTNMGPMGALEQKSKNISKNHSDVCRLALTASVMLMKAMLLVSNRESTRSMGNGSDKNIMLDMNFRSISLLTNTFRKTERST